MKKMNRNKLISGIMAGVLVICTLAIGLSVYTRLSSTDFQYGDEAVKGQVSSNNELEEVLADYTYDGTDSDYENKENGWKEINGKGLKYGKLNVLEIVPDTRYGYVGYMSEGTEPIADTDTERGYIMDAMVNNVPGSQYDAYQTQFYFNGSFGAVNLGDAGEIITQVQGKYSGYFLNVGTGKGVYALCDSGTEYNSEGYVTNVVMMSKFKISGGNYNHGTYDYVWVETPDVTFDEGPKTTQTQMSNLKEGDAIYVYEYRKCKYQNNNLLGNLIYKTDDIRVFTRTASQLKDEPDLVRNVDIIFLSSSQEAACSASYNAYVKMYGEGAAAGTYDDSNDIPWEQVLTIYDRVVNKENLAIITAHSLANAGALNRNMQRLIFMLYNIEDNEYLAKQSNTSAVTGSGRAFFNNMLPNLLKTNEKESEVFAKVKDSADSSDDDYTDIRVSDIVYIDEVTGHMKVNGSYSGKYYQGPISDKVNKLDKSEAKWEYNDGADKDLEQWSSALLEDWMQRWANGYGSFWIQVSGWMKNDDGSLQDWVTYDDDPIDVDGTLYIHQSNQNNNSLFPLYKQFCAEYTFEYDPGIGCYRNQYIHNDTGMTFVYGSGGELGSIADSFKVIENNKITPEKITTDGSKKRIVYMTMNIQNGNSVNTDIAGANKNIYINEYEFENTDKLKNSFEIAFEMKSTHPVKDIVLTIGKETLTFTYSGSPKLDDSQVDDPANMDKYLTYTCDDGPTLTLTHTGFDEDVIKDSPDGYGVTSPVYVYSGTITGIDPSYFNSTNTAVNLKAISNFVLEKDSTGAATNYLSCEDNMTIVKNTFFDLD